MQTSLDTTEKAFNYIAHLVKFPIKIMSYAIIRLFGDTNQTISPIAYIRFRILTEPKALEPRTVLLSRFTLLKRNVVHSE